MKGISSPVLIDNLTVTKNASQQLTAIGFVDRGDHGTDFNDSSHGGTLTIDDAWHDLDLSAIVPAGAKAVLLYVYMHGTAAGSAFAFRKNGYTSTKTFFVLEAANVGKYASCIVACDTNRVIEYLGSVTTTTDAEIIVAGWFL